MNAKVVFFLSSVFILFSACSKVQEMTLSEIEELTKAGDSALIKKTVSKPKGENQPGPGKVGGTWFTSIFSDPKTFNQLIAERDNDSSQIISSTLDYLVDYDMDLRKWIPHAAYFEVETDEKKGTLTVHYTLRDDLYWTWYGSDKKVPVTSDDFVFWYNNITGNPEFGSSGYGQHFVVMPDGEEKEVECVKIDDKRFDFIFPRIVAEPLLATNMSLCPSFIFREAYEKGGAEGVKNLFPANVDVKTIPSCGKWYIAEYTPAQRLVYKRNPYYWEKDENGVSIPYQSEMLVQIVGDINTEYLLFKQGKLETYNPRPEEISEVVDSQKNDYTVYNAEGSLSSSLWSFNQNPKNKNDSFYIWFTNKKFRQAMSCLLNRERIINQTYRGLAEPKYSFFPEVNPFYDPEIYLQYRFNPERAVALLESIGFYRDKDGFIKDASGIKVEFDLTVPSVNTVINDIALIISDEASRVGITINVRQVDFQKIIEQLTQTYDWQSVIIGLGTSIFPSQGSNVWPSSGNLHLWNPLQEKPATEWEERVDYLYNEGCYTNNSAEAKKYWDEYQRIILEELPVIYLVRSKSFFAIRNKWNQDNFYYDNKNGAYTDWIYLKE